MANETAAAAVGPWLAVLSHLAFLPAIGVLVWRSRLGYALQFSLMTFVSAVYHVLDGDLTAELWGRGCAFWGHADLLFALWAFVIALMHVIAFRGGAEVRAQWYTALLATSVCV
jgi:hypothetical protein